MFAGGDNRLRLENPDLDKQQEDSNIEELKKHMKLEYEKIHQLLDEDLAKTLQLLDEALYKFHQDNQSQALQLKHQLREASEMQKAVQRLLYAVDNIDMMKNTKSVTVFMHRANKFLASELPDFSVQLQYKDLVSEVSKKEKLLEKMVKENKTAVKRRGSKTCFQSFKKSWQKDVSRPESKDVADEL